jgi:hypothetical protein
MRDDPRLRRNSYLLAGIAFTDFVMVTNIEMSSLASLASGPMCSGIALWLSPNSSNQ